ncbi:PLP-dependent cysteine synthase family protein [Kineococcus glutinatus]|uniref:L-cysteine desulfhydrase Cds1 n=1 Tax=Kineococcus glutinatus TaxID=1070872 RepID=A0ABP9HN60_9ACTN
MEPAPPGPADDVRSTRLADRAWVAAAVALVRAEQQRSADTHLRKVHVPGPGVDLYLKDESTHPTGSLKHRLARSLFLYHLCNGAIGPATTAVEASSGSTAVSEAYFARLVGIPFVAVMPRSTSAEKIALIEAEGGRCHLVERAGDVYAEAERLAAGCGGLYLDQFTHAERATDWRGNNNIAESVFEQMAGEPHPVPRWIVVGAGTGGTSATIGRYLRYRGVPTELAVVDPEGSAFLDGFRGRPGATTAGSRIEGIGRPRVEPSFVPTVVDRVLRIPDAASVAGMRLLRERAGIGAGPSTGTNLCAALRLACEMRAAGEEGSVVTLVCDRDERYRATYADDGWVAAQGWDPAPHREVLARAWDTGDWR